MLKFSFCLHYIECLPPKSIFYATFLTKKFKKIKNSSRRKNMPQNAIANIYPSAEANIYPSVEASDRRQIFFAKLVM